MRGKWVHRRNSSRNSRQFISRSRYQQKLMWSFSGQTQPGFEFLRHELRTPMLGILGMAELIVESGCSGEQRQYMAALQSSAHQMSGLIESIPAARTPATCNTLAGGPVHARFFLEHIIRSHWPAAKNKGVALFLHIHHELPSYWSVDLQWLRQVLDNLLTNAIKFTNEGFVMLEARALRNPVNGRFDLEITIQDTGIGIPTRVEDGAHAVEEQGVDATDPQLGGSGLGLRICRSIVRQCGGWIEHTAIPGGGTCFTVMLPGISCHPEKPEARLRPALLRRFSCRIALPSPVNRVVGDLLRAAGVHVEHLKAGEALEQVPDCGALICEPGRIEQRGFRPLPGIKRCENQQLVLVTRIQSRQLLSKTDKPGFCCADVPQPVLRSNLEPMLMRIALLQSRGEL